MKLTLPRGELERALRLLLVETPVDQQESHLLSGAGCLQLVASADRLSLTTSTQTMASKSEIDAKVERMGNVTVPARAVRRLARLAADHQPLNIFTDQDNGDFIATSGGLRVRLRPTTQRPIEPPDPIDKPIALTAADLRNLERIMFACDSKASAVALRGVHLGKREAVALDNRRIAMISPFPINADAVVPRDALEHVLRHSRGFTCEVSVRASWIIFGCGSTRWAATLIAMPFPDYRPALRSHSPWFVRVPVRLMVDMLERMTIVQDSHSAVYLSADSSGRVTLKSNVQEAGSVIEQIESEASFNDTICFNGHYLKHALEVLTEEWATLEITGPLKPVIIREPPLTTALMPLATPKTRESGEE